MNAYLALFVVAAAVCSDSLFASDASIPLYEYGSSAGNDPAMQGWTVIGAGDSSTLVSCDGALTAAGSGWRLCDSSTSGALGLAYDWSNLGRPLGTDWTLTMNLQWEEDKIDATGNIGPGGSRYFLTGDRQSFVWRVGNGSTGFYEIRFGKGEGSTITASNGSGSQPVIFANFGKETELTLAVLGGKASLMLGDEVLFDQLELTLSEDECRRLFLGDPTGSAQGSVTLNSIRFVPEPSAALLAFAGSAAFLGRRRRPATGDRG